MKASKTVKKWRLQWWDKKTIRRIVDKLKMGQDQANGNNSEETIERQKWIIISGVCTQTPTVIKVCREEEHLLHRDILNEPISQTEVAKAIPSISKKKAPPNTKYSSEGG